MRVYIYGASLIASATGFLYWVIAAKHNTDDEIGKVVWTARNRPSSHDHDCTKRTSGIHKDTGFNVVSVTRGAISLVWAPTIALRPVLVATRNAKYLSYAQTINAATRTGLGIAILLTTPTVTGEVIGYLIGFLAVTTSTGNYSTKKILRTPYLENLRHRALEGRDSYMVTKYHNSTRYTASSSVHPLHPMWRK